MRVSISVVFAVLLAFPSIAVGAVDCVEDAMETPRNYEDQCSHRADVSSIYTVDVRIKQEHLNEREIIVEVPYANLRGSGAIIQLYYSLAVGKAQWLPLPSNRGIYIMPDALLLPVGSWIDSGLLLGSYVRIVLITGN